MLKIVQLNRGGQKTIPFDAEKGEYWIVDGDVLKIIEYPKCASTQTNLGLRYAYRLAPGEAVYPK